MAKESHSAVTAGYSGSMPAAFTTLAVRSRLHELGLKVISNTPEEFAAMIRTGIDQYGRLVGSAGLKAQ